jgi:hypothetical protein
MRVFCPFSTPMQIAVSIARYAPNSRSTEALPIDFQPHPVRVRARDDNFFFYMRTSAYQRRQLHILGLAG